MKQEQDLEDDALLADDYEDTNLNNNDDFGFMDDFGGYGGSPTSLEKHSDLLKQLTNFNKFVRDKINGWLGLRWDEDTQKYVRDKYSKPVMNKRCATWCIDFMRTYTRDNNLLTDISRHEYGNIIQDVIDVVWLDIGTRPEAFGIKSDADLHRICVELQHAIELVLMGAGDGKYTKFLGQSTQRTENVSYQGGMPMQMAGAYPATKQRVGLFGKAKQMLFGNKR